MTFAGSEPSNSESSGTEPPAGNPAGSADSSGHEYPPLEHSATPDPAPDSPVPTAWPPPGAPAYPPVPPPTSVGGYPPPPAYPSIPPAAPIGGYPPPPAYPPPPDAYPPPAAGYPGYPPPYPGEPLPYPPAGYTDPYSYGMSPPQPGTNGLAIGSLVASIIGVLCCVGSVVGIVLGIIALNQINARPQGGKGMAIAGISIGAVTLVLAFLYLAGRAGGHTL